MSKPIYVDRPLTIFALFFLLALSTVLGAQYFAARHWESLLFDHAATDQRRAILGIGFWWGLVGVSVLELFLFWSVDPPLVAWLFDNGRIFMYWALCTVWVMWCARSIAYQSHDSPVWLANIAVSALMLTLAYPVLSFLKDGYWFFPDEQLMGFVVCLLMIATTIRMGMIVLGFTRIRQGLDLNLLGQRWLSPSGVFLICFCLVNIGIMAAFWSAWPAQAALLDTVGSKPATPLGDWLNMNGASFMGWTLIAAAAFTLMGSSYNRRVYAALEDMYLWTNKDIDFPRSMRGLLSNTRLIRSTLDMTRIGVVFWKSPEYRLGIGHTDLRSGYTYISAGFIHDEGLSRVPVYSNLPDFWAASIHPEDQGGFAALQDALKDPSRNHFAHVVRFAGPDDTWMFVKGEALVERDAQGRPLAFYGIHTDVSEQVSDNRKLLASNDRKLHAMRTLGHDMQSNLATLSMSLDLMQRRLDKGDTSTFAQSIVRMRTAVRGAMDLLSDTVAIAKSEDSTAAVKLIDVRMRAFVADIVATQLERYRVPDSKIDIQCEPQMMLREVNAFALSSLLANLLSNAVKYTPDALGQVTISVRPFTDETGQRRARIEVADEGIGIPLEFQSTLFQAFERADNVGTIPGTGLGMTIVRSSLESLNASIRFETMPQRETGTCFVVELPNRFERMLPSDLERLA